jgi:DNA repair protein RadC
MQVKLTKAQKIKLLNSADIYSIMQQVLLRENKIDRNKEHFWTIGLDGVNRVLYVELISLGTTQSVQVEPMQVYRVAILKAALKIVLVHNHPSSELQATKEDIDLTDRLVQVGNIIGIKVVDHLIISEKSYNSFADTNVLQQIEESILYLPSYKLQEKIKKEVEKIAEEKGVQKEKKQLVLMMKKENYSIAAIQKLSGLTAKQINLIKSKP